MNCTVYELYLNRADILNIRQQLLTLCLIFLPGKKDSVGMSVPGWGRAVVGLWLGRDPAWDQVES